MKKARVLAVVVCVVAAGNVASADTFGSGANQFTMDFVNIGNAGNGGDIRVEANPYGCGAVSYKYRIGKYEVTNAQWDGFVAAAGAPTGYPSYAYDESASWTGAQQPTTHVSWYEAAQFCNYLTSGDKYSGAYNFDQSGNFLGIDRNSAVSSYEIVYVIPSENEWYKAAYYKPDGSGYSLYANGENTIPAPDEGWNYLGGSYSTPWSVGTGTEEQNGTFDMMGNVWEWNETFLDGDFRVLRGGAYHFNVETLASSFSSNGFPYSEDEGGLGFRVASIPEPATVLLLGLGGVFLRSRK